MSCRHTKVSSLAYVCTHLFDGLTDSIPRHIYTSTDSDGETNAYCVVCEAYRLENGGEWPDDAAMFLNLKVICRDCYERLVKLSSNIG